MTCYGDCVLRGHFVRVETCRRCLEPFQMFVYTILSYSVPCEINTHSTVFHGDHLGTKHYGHFPELFFCLSTFSLSISSESLRPQGPELLCFHSTGCFLLFLRCLPHCYDPFFSFCLKVEALTFFSLFEVRMCVRPLRLRQGGSQS